MRTLPRGGGRSATKAARSDGAAASVVGHNEPAPANGGGAGTNPAKPPAAPVANTIPVSTARCPGLKLKSPNRVRGTTIGATLSEAARHKRLTEIGLYQTKGTVRPEYLLGAVVEERVVCDVTIVRVAPSSYDDDNYIAACKWLRDGIAAAFKVPDNHPNLRFWYEQRHGRPKEYRVDIEYRFRRLA